MLLLVVIVISRGEFSASYMLIVTWGRKKTEFTIKTHSFRLNEFKFKHKKLRAKLKCDYSLALQHIINKNGPLGAEPDIIDKESGELSLQDC